MSFGIAILLTKKELTLDDYSRFLNECARSAGKWHIREHKALDPGSDDIVHDCVLIDESGKAAKQKQCLSVWITLSKEEHTRKYGRSRRKIHWMIYIETKAGRSFWDLAVQMIIPMRAFSVFSEIIVVVDPERLFLEPEAYTTFAKRELIAELGEEALKESGLLDADGRLKTEATSDGA